MPQNPQPVKGRIAGFIDCHPRVGWYIAGIATLNTVLHILQFFFS